MAAISGTMPETEDALVLVEEYIARFVEVGEKPTCEWRVQSRAGILARKTRSFYVSR